MSSNDDQPNREIEILESVADKGALAKAKAYTKLSGPCLLYTSDAADEV